MIPILTFLVVAQRQEIKFKRINQHNVDNHLLSLLFIEQPFNSNQVCTGILIQLPVNHFFKFSLRCIDENNPTVSSNDYATQFLTKVYFIATS